MPDELNGYRLEVWDLSRCIEAWADGVHYGMASPWDFSKPQGAWYSRRSGEPAVKLADRAAALAHLTREPPCGRDALHQRLLKRAP